ncbi:MAG: glutamine--tRNA ligase/YqeY domain fusion protein [Arenicella sp.]
MSNNHSDNNSIAAPNNFIRNIITDDLDSGKHQSTYTRFPPEPNGYLHIGHAKSICLNFGIAEEFNGKINLRFDDTNPEKESDEYMLSIKDNVTWLGFTWDELRHASDYFDKIHDYAVELIEKGLAYVDSLSPEQMREYRGTLKEPGKNSPYRDRSIEENLDLFTRMKAGEFKEGEHALRAKIDMSSPQIILRDPVIYRIKYAHHFRAGDKWCIYPMYDFTHCISDALEGITHSLCTLEFQDNRAVYDWVLDNISIDCHPRQYEFGRLNLKYTVLSKRKLNQLVQEGHVSGWDDPRLPTIAGIRRRGYTPNAIREFCREIGITKKDSLIEMTVLENSIRHDLEANALRAFGVLKPLKVVITNFPEDKTEWITAKNHPKDESLGTRDIPFTREVYIDQDDFMLDPPKKFFRLGPDREVRLRYGYAIKCHNIIQDNDGNVIELHCTYDPESAGGKTADGRKIKGIIHWVSAEHAVDAEVRRYDRLFKLPNPSNADNFIEQLNPESLVIFPNAKLEHSLGDSNKDSRFQFERVGYFWQDSKDSKTDNLVFNQIVSLRDSWARVEKEQQP